MTTDPFTEREEAAEDAADRWTHQQGYAMTGTEWGAFEQGHLTGSAWARTHLAALEPARVPPAWIEEQRTKGWPDMHPEDYCHRCGNRNPSWFVDTREQWLAGTQAWAAETGREGICCPMCFMEMWTDVHGPGWALAVHATRPGGAAQEPGDAEVEAAAQSLYGDDPAWGFVVQFAYGTEAVDWEDIGDDGQEMFRRFARAALSAARAARRDEEKR